MNNYILIKFKGLTKRLKDLEDSWKLGVPHDFDINEQFMPLKKQFDELQILANNDYPKLFNDFKPQLYSVNILGGFNALQSLISDVNYFISLLEQIETPSINNIKLSKEGIYFAGQQFDAFVKINEIINNANNDIILIDGYIDINILDMFKDKNLNTNIRILTKLKSYSDTIKQAELKFNEQYKNISIKTSENFHDRFLIIDNVEYYHFGASLKDAGNRGFMFSVIEEKIMQQRLIDEFNKEWNKNEKKNY